MTPTKPVSPQKFVEELQSELSVIYGTPSEIVIGKNKLLFKIGSIDFRMEKNREKLDNTRLSIIECLSFDDMFPCSIMHDPALTDFKYYPHDIQKAVSAIDSYIMSKTGSMPICTGYSLLKWALLPMFMSDFNNITLLTESQDKILEILAAMSKDETVAAGGRFLVPFVARSIDTDEDSACLLFDAAASSVTVHKIKLVDGKISDKDKDYCSYNLDPDEYPGIQMASAVRKLFRDCYDFRLCDWKTFSVQKEEKKDQGPVIDPDEELRYIISNKPYYD